MNEWINWYHLPVAQNWYKTGSRICSVLPSAHEQSRAFRGAVNFTPRLRTVLILATQILGGFERPKLAWKDTRFLDFPYDILMQDRPAHAKFKVERTFFLGRLEVTLRTHKSNDAILSPARYFSRTSATSPNHQPYNQFFLEIGHVTLSGKSHYITKWWKPFYRH